MIQKFKKWLTVGTVGSKFSLFKFIIIGELILIIGLVVCMCNNHSLKKEKDALQQQIDNQTIMLEHIDEKVLTPLGLKTF
jgi:hypothetical protein